MKIYKVVWFGLVMGFLKSVMKGLKKRNKPLTTSGVRFSYSEKEVLRDISMSLKEKEMVAIIGKSGSGKSTFLKLLSGVISSRYYGRIKIFGKPKFLRKSQLGFVPQELAFIPDLSLLDNIKIAGLNLGLSEKFAVEKAGELLKLLKLDEVLSKKPFELSGGQKVRLNIVLSLLHDPKIFILDEPFVGLDFMNRRLLWHFLEKMKKKGKSVILTSHLLTETQEHVDRLVILKKGRVFFSGNVERLKSKLKFNYIFEMRFSYLSKDNLEKLKKFCIYKDIRILDIYDRLMVFALNSERQRKTLISQFEKLNLKFEEIGFREPNLDEVFLKA